MKIIDNFLPPEEFNYYREMFLDNTFPWYWGDEKVKGEYNHLQNYQFYHLFYENNRTYSTKDITSIVDRLNANAICRIKANLTVNTEKIHRYEFHVDTKVKCTTAILYLNSNDGFTIFENGAKVDSVANRMLIFDSDKRHAGTTCTNSKRRVVLNFNFF